MVEGSEGKQGDPPGSCCRGPEQRMVVRLGRGDSDGGKWTFQGLFRRSGLLQGKLRHSGYFPRFGMGVWWERWPVAWPMAGCGATALA